MPRLGRGEERGQSDEKLTANRLAGKKAGVRQHRRGGLCRRSSDIESRGSFQKKVVLLFGHGLGPRTPPKIRSFSPGIL